MNPSLGLGVALALATTSCTWMSRLAVHSESEAATLMLRHVEKYHYSNVSVDDRVSLETLENFLRRLDSQRLYFTAEDADGFRARYGDLLDDALRLGQLGPVREIYDMYRRRRAEHIEFVLRYVESLPDLNTGRQWVPDRDEEPWPADQSALEQVWKDQLRHQFINLILEDRSYEAARALLHHGYRRVRESDASRAGFDFGSFMESFANALDPHSHYSSIPSPGSALNAEDGADFDGRIGISLEEGTNQTVVKEVFPGGPAAEHGLKPGDRIVALDIYGDGRLEDVEGWSPPDVARLSRGSAGTTLVVRVLPAHGESEAYVARLKRVRASQVRASQAWTWQVYEGAGSLPDDLPSSSKKVLRIDQDGRPLRIGVIAIRRFSRGSARDVKGLLGELRSEGVDGVLLDLRNNPGGRMRETIRIIGFFLGKGPVGQVRDRKGQLKVQRSPVRSAIWDGPLAVLVNRSSASGSEIFSAAIQDHGRGLVVGQRTFGKSSGSRRFSIKVGYPGSLSDATMEITAFMAYRATGRNIHLRGIFPDIELPAADTFWPLSRSPAPDSTARAPGLPDGEPFPSDETIAADFKPADASRLQVAALAARHRQRASRKARWRLMEEQYAQITRPDNRSPVPLNLDLRRRKQAAQCARELERTTAWLEKSALGTKTVEPAQAEFFRQRKDSLLPRCLAANLDDPALLRALFTARGQLLLPAEQGYKFERFDLALEQTARIVADMVRLEESNAPIATASRR